MSVRVLEAQAVISAHDRTGNTFQRVAGKMGAVTRAAGTLNQRAAMISRSSANIQGASGLIAAHLGRVMAPVAIGYAAKRSFQRYAETENAITRIGITADATDAQIDGLHKTLRSLSFESAMPFDGVTQGLSELVSGGMDLPESMPAMPAIVRTAQAAGAEVADIAKSSLALNQALGISTSKMKGAFDIMVEGGKAGKFELKDMARYFPSLAPAAAAAGMKGEAGLKRMVALLQVIRNGTGSVEEAASSASNIFAKMESEETAKRFKKFGVDLRKEMTKARTEGRDLVSVFTDLTQTALKGDLSKIPQLFTDMEFARGMRALLTYRSMIDDVMGRLEKAQGSTDRDFERVASKGQATINRLAESWDRATEALGRYLSQAGGSKGLNWIAEKLEKGAEAEQRQRETAPKTLDELRARMLSAKDAERLAGLDRSVVDSEREVMRAREGVAGGRPFARHDLARSQAKLEGLRTEKEMLRLDMAARQITIPEPPQFNEAELQKIRDALNVSVPLPHSDPRRVPLPVPRPRSSMSFPEYGSIDNMPAQVADGVRNAASAAPVEATLKGQADINVKVTVETGPDFWAKVKSTVSGVIGNLRANNGTPDAGTAGSTGKTMPETGAMP